MKSGEQMKPGPAILLACLLRFIVGIAIGLIIGAAESADVVRRFQ